MLSYYRPWLLGCFTGDTRHMTLVQDFLPAEADTSNDMTTNQAIVDACREAGFKAYIE